MIKFKAGNIIKIKEDCSGCKRDEICKLQYGTKNGEYKNDLWAIGKKSNGCGCEDNWELVKKGKVEKEKPMKFIVSWEVKDCGDPQERFVTFVEANKKARELAQDDDVITSSIDIVEIKNKWQVTPTITIKKEKI